MKLNYGRAQPPLLMLGWAPPPPPNDGQEIDRIWKEIRLYHDFDGALSTWALFMFWVPNRFGKVIPMWGKRSEPQHFSDHKLNWN